MAYKNCLNCGKEFSVRPSRIGITKFCSKKCTGEYQTKVGRVQKTCPVCGKGFSLRKSISLRLKGDACCSFSCASEFRKGKNNRLNYRKHHLDNVEIDRLYTEGNLAAGKIGQRFGVSGHTIALRLKDMGIPIRSHSEVTRLSAKRGPDCHWWTGGRHKDSNGYVTIRMPDHRLANATGTVKEHHLVWEKHHGKQVPKGWVVHHLNGVRDDNRPENLAAMPRIAHTERENGILTKTRIKELEAEIEKLKAKL